jgi:hypothetical protein
LMIFIVSISPGCRSSDNDLKPYDRTDMPVKISHLRGHLYLVEDYNFRKTNTLFWVSEKGGFFINATYQYKTAKRVEWKAASLTMEDFHGMILTGPGLHYSGGAAFFYDRHVRIFSHPLTKAVLESQWDTMNTDFKSEFSQWDTARPFQTELLDFRSSENTTESTKTDSCSGSCNDKYPKISSFMDGEILAIDPGLDDMPGSLIVYFPSEKVLFGGDIISGEYPEIPLTSESKQRQSLRKYIRSLHPDMIISGHGRAVYKLKSPDRNFRAIRF